MNSNTDTKDFCISFMQAFPMMASPSTPVNSFPPSMGSTQTTDTIGDSHLLGLPSFQGKLMGDLSFDYLTCLFGVLFVFFLIIFFKMVSTLCLLQMFLLVCHTVEGIPYILFLSLKLKH